MIPTPPYAYIPGQTPRHDEELFAGLAASISGELSQTLAWRAGLKYLDTGFFWEAHEALEPVWMAAAPNSVDRHFVQGLIQFANASLKSVMQRQRAVLRLCDIAQDHLSACGDYAMGQNVEQWQIAIRKLKDAL